MEIIRFGFGPEDFSGAVQVRLFGVQFAAAGTSGVWTCSLGACGSYTSLWPWWACHCNGLGFRMRAAC